MTENTGNNGGGSLYFIVGGLVVAVGLGAFAYYNGLGGKSASESTVGVPAAILVPAAKAPAATPSTPQPAKP